MQHVFIIGAALSIALGGAARAAIYECTGTWTGHYSGDPACSFLVSEVEVGLFLIAFSTASGPVHTTQSWTNDRSCEGESFNGRVAAFNLGQPQELRLRTSFFFYEVLCTLPVVEGYITSITIELDVTCPDCSVCGCAFDWKCFEWRVDATVTITTEDGGPCASNNIERCGFAPGDCDGDGVLDSCAPDCDGDGVPNACDPDGCLEPGPADVDFDLDCQVGFTDLLAVLAAWGSCPAPPALCPIDLDGDGVVGFSELLAVLAAWGPYTRPPLCP